MSNIAKKQNNTQQSNKTVTPTKVEEHFAFGPMNYILVGIGILLLGIGYILLSGGGSEDPNMFNDAMFDSRRLVVAPLMIVAGLVVEICAIMFRSKKEKNEE